MLFQLSHALVAFTIELDNEFEHRMHGPGRGPWLTSYVMYANCLAFVPPDGIAIGELERLARHPAPLSGLTRWRYVEVPTSTGRLKSDFHSDDVVRLTPKGRQAQETWQPLAAEIESRWAARTDLVALRKALVPLVSSLELDLPDYLPVLGYGLRCREAAPRPAADGRDLPLPTLLSRVLHSAALDFERQSKVSLALSANCVRVLGETPVRLRDLPGLTGVSKEAIAMATGLLERTGLAHIEPIPGGRGKQISLLEKGLRALHFYQSHGSPPLPDFEVPPMPAPYSDNWRAKVKPPALLPHFPMVLHRGGFPDGS